jgi:RNA polymerase sigma-70 factor (ECF subfamily)
MDATTQQKTFARWMDEHSAILHRVVNGFAGANDRADLMQEVLIAVWQAIPRFRGEAQPATFLYRVSHNVALTWHRSHRRHNRLTLGSDLEIPCAPSPGTDERLEHLYAAIRQLPEVDRSLILLSLDGVSYRAMADIHGCSENYVGVRLNRIRKQLTQILNPQPQP